MDIAQLYVSQRTLWRAEQVPALVEAILNEEDIPPIRITESEDGTLQVHDGHHRIVAYNLAGRTRLEDYEYELSYTARHRPRFGQVADLMKRCGLCPDAAVRT